MSREVVLLGKGDLAIKVGNWFAESERFSVVAVVPSIPPPAWTGSLVDWAKTNNLPLVESGRYEDIPHLKDPNWRPDVALSIFYSRIIRQDFIDRCGRILNLHNSPLPRYRGVSPINWALKNGESHHGVTIHEITEGIDDGPILNQVIFIIDPERDEVIDVYKRCLGYGFALFKDTIERLDTIRPKPQDKKPSLYYSRKDNDRLEERRYFTREESLRRLRTGERTG